MEHDRQHEHGWVERPWAARAVGVVAFVVPFAASIVAAYVLSSLLPQAPTVWWGIFRWVGVAIASTVVLVVVERQTRRLLPLRTLLGLTLAFPDRAPSRFKIAIRTGTTNQLRSRLEEARAGKLGDTPSEAAERLLELVGMLSQHDRLTRGHSERVRAYAHLIGEEMGMSGTELDRLRWAGLLHDVGKLEIDAEILNKPGKLTVEEYELIKGHPMAGKQLVAPLADWLGESARAVWEHHERLDGQGYPQGLAGSEISLAARIVSVADVYDVMTSVRSYKLASSPAEAREELVRCAGTQFDPDAVQAFLAVSVSRLRSTMGPLSWLAQLALFPQAVVSQAGSTLVTTAAVTAGATAGSVGIAASPVAAMAFEEPVIETISTPFDGEFDGLEFSVPSETVIVVTPDRVPELLGETPGDPFADRRDLPPGDETPTTRDPADGTTTTVVPTASGATTTLPPTTTTTVASRGSTLPSATTTEPPTTEPPTTTSTTTTTTTTTAPPTTTTTAPPTTTTTTIPAAVGNGMFYLSAGGSGDTTSSPVLPFTDRWPTETTLYNYDTDRDGAPGLLLERSAAGVDSPDPAQVQVFNAAFSRDSVFEEDIKINFYVAAKDFLKTDLHVAMSLVHCDLRDNCTTLGDGDKVVKNAERFKINVFVIGSTGLTVQTGERIELRVAVLDDSDADMWLAFGTSDYDSSVLFR